MASVNWMKATTQKAGGLKKHLGQTERENGNHSNEHIDRELSHQNYAIGCDYAEALAQIEERQYAADMQAKGVQTIWKYGVAFCGKNMAITLNE